jgi:hypothetical protein
MTPDSHTAESPKSPLALVTRRTLHTLDRRAGHAPRPRLPETARWLALVVASAPGVVLALAVLLFSTVAVLLLTAARACAAIRLPRPPRASRSR